MNVTKKALAACAAASVALGLILPAAAAPTTGERLRNADNEPHNWLMTLGNYQGWHYSKLAQINKNNVANLRVVFMAAIGGSATQTRSGNPYNQEQSAPLVEDGFLYLTDGHNKLMKFDVRSGNRALPLWRFDPRTEMGGSVGGFALYGDTVISAIRDARIIGVNKESGEQVWEANGKEPPGGPNAPEFVATRTFRGAISTLKTAGGKDIIVVGAGGAGIGWIGGFDAKNGKDLWRTYTIPQPGEPNFGTWPEDKWKWGAAMPWGPSTYDVTTNTILMGTGEPSPVYDPEFRPGDNLYSVSTLALDAETGKMKWFFQHTPNDPWDFDSTGVRMIHDFRTADGRTVKAVSNWDRNGFTYTLNGATGEFLQAVAQVDNINWTKGIDAKTGKPREYLPGQVLQPYAVNGPRRGRPQAEAPMVCATWGGAPTGIWPPSLDPTTGITYNTRTSGCTYQTMVRATVEAFNPLARECLGCSVNQVQVDTKANLIAMDLRSGKVVNTYTRDLGIPSDRQAEVGALATGGGLVFTGFDDGTVHAFDKDTLAELWSFNTGTGLKGAMISYAVGGKQYIAHIAGGDNPGVGIRRLILPTAMLVVYGL
jgi:alcohol dehydrogenase (cytochrome c)